VSQISFVFWFLNPVRLKRFARFWAFRAPTGLVERSRIRPGQLFVDAGCESTEERGLVLMRARSRQLEVRPARREARVLKG
jgi:hypothetical protein